MNVLIPVRRRALSFTAGRGTVRVIRRRFTVEAAPTAPPKKKPRIIRRIIWSTTALIGTFYVGSTFVAFKNQKYYDFFSDHVPLGQSMLEYAESHSWDTMTVQSAISSTKNTASSVQKTVMDKVNGTTSAAETAKHATEKKAEEVKKTVVKAVQESKAKVQHVASTLKTEVKEGSGKATAAAKHQASQFTHEIQSLVRQAEEAISGKYPEHIAKPSTSPASTNAAKPSQSPESTSVTDDVHVYSAPLPVGFEPPPGFSWPVPPAPKKEEALKPTESSLPLVTPSITNTEPIITHLAGTIDKLASYVKSNPNVTSQVAPILENAKSELSALIEHIDKVRKDERDGLETKLDEQAREYSVKLLDLEMAAQDKLDNQEDEFRKFFDQERVKIIQAYRDKIDNELKTQTELINQRLKEEVIAQGIELQRRWIREIKVRVEQERGGRLSKLEELAAHLQKVERIAIDNSQFLDENIRVHALWSAIRTVSSSALSSPVRKPFREELRVLRHIATAREDPVVSSTLSALESTDIPDVGVEPFADLASWFSTSVAPKVSTVALVPDKDAGLLSHLASHLLSTIQFRRRGLVEGNDVLSVLARAEYYLNEKDLDTATRELNQLRGTAKVLLEDWLAAARRRLEVEQALEVVQTQATLSSLLVVE